MFDLSPLEVQRFEAYTNVIVGLGAWLHAFVLRRRPYPRVSERRLSAMLFALGIGYFFRGLEHAHPFIGSDLLHTIFTHAKLIGFGFLPLLMFLFTEHLLGRHLRMWPKLLLLLMTPFFTLTFFLPLALSNWWGLLLTGLQGVIFLYLIVEAMLRRRQLKLGPERSFLTGLLIAAFVSVPLLATDWFGPLNMVLPSLSAFPTFGLLYFALRAFSSNGRFRHLHAWRRLFAALLTLSSMLLLVAFFLPDVAFAQLFHLGFILLTTFLVVDPLQEIFDDMRQKNVATLLARLKRLPRTSTSVFIDAFSQWPEVERAHFFNEGELQKNGYDQVCDTLSQHPNTLTRDSLWLDVNSNVMALEQIDHLMKTHRVDRLAGVGPKDCLGVTFTDALNAETYDRVLGLAAALCPSPLQGET